MKKTREDKVVDAITVVLLVIVLIIIVIPFLAVLSSAFEDEEILLEKGMALIPTSPTLDTFAYLFRGQIGGGKGHLFHVRGFGPGEVQFLALGLGTVIFQLFFQLFGHLLA